MDEDSRSRPPATHLIGETLDALSVDDLDARIALLRAEIARLETARAARAAARSAADSVFGARRPPSP